MKVYLPPITGFNKLDDTQVPIGTIVEIIAPSGFYWTPHPSGGVVVHARWWRKLLTRVRAWRRREGAMTAERREFERGRLNAIRDAEQKPIPDLWAAWDRCQWGDHYDRGYAQGLREARP